ncbi:MAG: hypothetical protein JKY56_06690 [Kofleriaceae bacterium]|nr:hypothetical protein [Kofleriaceae bacterium]
MLLIPDWGICNGNCETLGENDCLIDNECRGIYISTCGGDVPCQGSDDTFSECWSVSDSPPLSESGCSSYDAGECSRHNECSAVHAPKFNGGASDFYFCRDEADTGPGSCTGDVNCRALPPECPAGTTPGIMDGCWSGFCIPLDQCESLPSCEDKGEELCVASSYCDPIYQGVNCECQGDQCECERWDYQHCEGSTLTPSS